VIYRNGRAAWVTPEELGFWFRVLNTCLYRGFRAVLADPEEAELL